MKRASDQSPAKPSSVTAIPQGIVRLGSTGSAAPERTWTAFIREGGCECSQGQIQVKLRSIEGRRLGSQTVLFFTWRVRQAISADSEDRSNERTNGNRGGDRGVRSKARRDDGLRRHRGIVDLAEEYAAKSRVEPRKRMERRETPHAPSAQRFIIQPKNLRRSGNRTKRGCELFSVDGSRRSFASPIVLLPVARRASSAVYPISNLRAVDAAEDRGWRSGARDPYAGSQPQTGIQSVWACSHGNVWS